MPSAPAAVPEPAPQHTEASHPSQVISALAHEGLEDMLSNLCLKEILMPGPKVQLLYAQMMQHGLAVLQLQSAPQCAAHACLSLWSAAKHDVPMTQQHSHHRFSNFPQIRSSSTASPVDAWAKEICRIHDTARPDPTRHNTTQHNTIQNDRNNLNNLHLCILSSVGIRRSVSWAHACPG